MAKLSVQDTGIMSVGKDSVSFKGIYIREIIVPSTPYQEGDQVREERNYFISGRVGDNLASTSPAPYTPGGTYGKIATLTIQLNYQYRVGAIKWSEWDDVGSLLCNIYNEEAGEGYESDELPEDDLDSKNKQVMYWQKEWWDLTEERTYLEEEYLYDDMGNPIIDEETGEHKYELIKKTEIVVIGTCYKYAIWERYAIYPWDNETEGWKNGYHAITQAFYTHPTKFIFNNCESNKQWQVDKGINSLLTNMLEFQGHATQWKYWKLQNGPPFSTNISAGVCPGWDSPLSATRLNEIYNYLGSSASYRKGDKVSAAMFNGLTDIINN